jgi:branched-subunit amino acid aminotransferase/4-amino-4-deoxychorismate lyase
MALTVPGHLEALRGRGIRLVSLASATDGSLRASSPWLLPGAKVSGSAAASAAWFEARRRGADDGVLVDLQGRVLEGPASNIWWRKDRILFTPSAALGILPGITSAAIAELASELGYEVSEGEFPLHELAAADEAFVTSTVAEVIAATELDGEPIGAGSVGPAARELHGGLRALARSDG